LLVFPEKVGDGLLLTAYGHEQLRAELETLETDGRRVLQEQLRDARGDGDLADNAGLLELLEEHARLEERIALLAIQLRAAEIVTPAGDGTADLGTCVRVCDLGSGEVREHDLVGALESDLGDGRVSIESPVGRALLGHRAGAVVEVETPSGLLALEIVSVGLSAAGDLESAA
jgi:transcription elongation factor GreA